MPRSRPASNPLSFHQATGQHYVTRGGAAIPNIPSAVVEAASAGLNGQAGLIGSRENGI